jgi:hypothetical protein
MNDCNTKIGFFSNQIDKLNQLIGDVRTGIKSLQDFSQIPAKVVSDENGEHVSVSTESKTTDNEVSTEDLDVLTVLGHIEKKANDLMTLHLAVNAPKNRNQIVIGEDGLPKEVSSLPSGAIGGLLGQGPTALVGRININAPSTGYLFLDF